MIKPPELDTDRGRLIWETITAAGAGDVRRLRDLLARDPGLATEYSPLGFAVREGHLEAVQLLLAAGADPDELGHDGDTLIETARDRGFEPVAAALEETRAARGRVVPAETHTDHPIHLAAEAGDLKAVRAWLDADPALLERSDRAGGTPLHRAVIGRAREVVTLLLDRGAHVDAIHGAGLGTRAGYAPENLQAIDLAIWGGPPAKRWPMWRMGLAWLRWRLAARPRRRPGAVDIARLLIARGAAHDLPTAAALGDLDRVTAILDEDSDRIRETRPNGRRPLWGAVEFGHDAIVRLLLERGTDPTWPDADDSPRGAALHAAARAGDRGMVELLLAHGADPNGFVDSAGNAMFAAKTGEIRALLAERGGQLDPFDLVWLNEDEAVVRRIAEDPQSAYAGCGGVLTAVCTRGKRELLIRLLEMGVRVPPIAGGCHSYLLENPGMLRILLEHGLSPDYPDWRNLTFLHLLCSRDVRNRTLDHRAECAGILLDAGATISARDEAYRSTPLAWAARNNLPDMVEFLLARGAPANLPDDPSWATPLAWSRRRGHAGIVATLRRAGALILLLTALTAAPVHGQTTDPTPLSGNPQPAYPAAARQDNVEGSVEFRAIINADGTVGSVAVTKVPREEMGLERAVEDAVAKWRFQPAMQAGKAIEAAYVGAIRFALSLPGEWIYPVSSKAAWTAVLKVAADLGLRAEKRDQGRQFLLTQFLTYRGRLLPDAALLQLQPGEVPEWIQFQIYVAPGLEPARVVIGSIIRTAAISTNDRRNAYAYNREAVRLWLLARLSTHLGVSPEPLAASAERRAEQTLRLLPTGISEPCATRGASIVGIKSSDLVGHPKPFHRVTPIYPKALADARTEGRMLFEAEVTEHGTLTRFRHREPADAPAEFRLASQLALGLWRFESGRIGACPGRVTATFEMSFILR